MMIFRSINRRVALGIAVSCLLAVTLHPGMLCAEEGKDDLPSAVVRAEDLWGTRTAQKLYLNLDDCVRMALVRNREIKMTEHEITKAEAKLSEASIIGRPILQYENLIGPAPKDVSNAVSSFFTGDVTVFNRFKLGLGIPLTTFGKIKRVKELASGGIEAASLNKAKKESKVIFQVKQLYYGVLLARELARLLNYASKEVDKEITKREEKGGTDPVELLKLKLFRSKTSKKLNESGNKELLALEAMRVLLGLEQAQSFDIKGSRLRPLNRKLHSFNYYSGVAYRQRSDIKLLQIGLKSRRLNYELEKRKYAPDLGMGGFFEIGRAPGVTGVTTTDDFSDPFNFTRAGIGLQLKGKFDYGTRKAKIRQAEADLLKTEIQAGLAVDGIQLEVKRAYLNVKSAKDELERAEESGKLARQVLFLTQSNYDIGLAEPKDLIDAIQGFLFTRGDFFKAVFDFNVAFAELNQKIEEMPENRS